MDIGGYDTIFEEIPDPVRFAKNIIDFLNWQDAVKEPDGHHDFFYYQDQVVKDLWDQGFAPLNKMVHFILGHNDLTIVTDKQLTDAIRQEFK